MMIRPKNIFIE